MAVLTRSRSVRVCFATGKKREEEERSDRKRTRGNSNSGVRCSQTQTRRIVSPLCSTSSRSRENVRDVDTRKIYILNSRDLKTRPSDQALETSEREQRLGGGIDKMRSGSVPINTSHRLPPIVQSLQSFQGHIRREGMISENAPVEI